MITILSVLLIVWGILFVIGTIAKGYDKTSIGKYNKIKFFLSLVNGFSYAIAGLLVILKVISIGNLISIVIIFGGLNSLIDYRFK
ncbi:hypothetical protein I6A86_17865 [Clostridioides difficile]|nr:hypothetical protein [Clostridioides difficile]MBZ0937827.1 hypothetical protein [Clostridioides difficile]